jgi:hypothetical protein
MTTFDELARRIGQQPTEAELSRRIAAARELIHEMREIGYGSTVDSMLGEVLAVLDGTDLDGEDA